MSSKKWHQLILVLAQLHMIFTLLYKWLIDSPMLPTCISLDWITFLSDMSMEGWQTRIMTQLIHSTVRRTSTRDTNWNEQSWYWGCSQMWGSDQGHPAPAWVDDSAHPGHAHAQYQAAQEEHADTHQLHQLLASIDTSLLYQNVFLIWQNGYF